jgi:hypothetical protein
MKRKCLPNADNAASKTLMQAHLKPQVLPKVFTSTARSNPVQPQTPVTSASSLATQNSLKTRSDRLRAPDSVAGVQRQLDPLAYDEVVKRLTS